MVRKTRKTDSEVVSDVPINVQNISETPSTENAEETGFVTASEDSDSDVEDTQTLSVRGPRLGQRFWKNDRKRFNWSVLQYEKPTLVEVKKRQLDTRKIRKRSKDIVHDRSETKRQKRERREENLKKRAENAKKAEIVQVVTDSAKLKKMKRKALRKIEKRDTSGMV